MAHIGKLAAPVERMRLRVPTPLRKKGQIDLVALGPQKEGKRNRVLEPPLQVAKHQQAPRADCGTVFTIENGSAS